MWWKAWHGWTRREEHQKSSNDEWMIFCLFFAFTSFLVFECSSFCNWENLLRSFDEWKQSNIINNKMKYKFSVYRREVTNLTDGKYWSERRTFVFLCEATTRKKTKKNFPYEFMIGFFFVQFISLLMSHMWDRKVVLMYVSVSIIVLTTFTHSNLRQMMEIFPCLSTLVEDELGEIESKALFLAMNFHFS